MVPLRVFNVSNKVLHFAVETVTTLAKPVIDATSLKLKLMKTATRVL